jgi:hypothetical protein
MLSISAGLIVLKSDAEIATPSSIYNGAVPELIELVPRIVIVAEALGSPELERTVRPAT